MKYISRLLAVVIVISMLLTSVNAEDTFDMFLNITLDLGTMETTVTQTEITGENDFSNLNVTVIEVLQGGIENEVYKGLLGGYDNGRWVNVDFSDNKPFVIYDWQTQSTFWVIPSTENNQASTMNLTGDLLSSSSDLEISSQIKINGVNTGENGVRIVDNANMSCIIGVTNNSNESKEITVILATYTETGVLHNVSTYSINTNAQSTTNTEIDYQFDADKEHTGKIMFWDSIMTMMPVRATINFSQESGANAYYYNADNRLLQVEKTNGTSLIYTYDNMGNLLTKTVRK